MCRNGRNFVAAVFAAGLVGADVVLVNTEFRINALAGALEYTPDHNDVRRRGIRGQIRDADESVAVIDPATVETQPGDSRPKVAASGRIVSADLGHHRRTQRSAAGTAD